MRAAKDKIYKKPQKNDKKPLKPQIFSFDKMMKMTVLSFLSYCLQGLPCREKTTSTRKKRGRPITR